MQCHEAGGGAFHGRFSPYGCHFVHVCCGCQLFVDGGVVIIQFFEEVGMVRAQEQGHEMNDVGIARDGVIEGHAGPLDRLRRGGGRETRDVEGESSVGLWCRR